MDFGNVINDVWSLWLRIMEAEITVWGLTVNGLGVLYASMGIMIFALIVFYYRDY